MNLTDYKVGDKVIYKYDMCMISKTYIDGAFQYLYLIVIDHRHEVVAVHWDICSNQVCYPYCYLSEKQDAQMELL